MGVEDNDFNVEVCKQLLEHMGQRVSVAMDGRDAVGAVVSSLADGAHEFDVILVDCDMPVMNGFEATAQIRRIEREQNVAKPVTIWALTAHAMNSVKAQCLECGMDAFLTKPLMLPVLRERLESLA